MRNKFHWDINTPYVQFKTDLPVFSGDRQIKIFWEESERLIKQQTTIALVDGFDFNNKNPKTGDYRRTPVRNYDTLFQEGVKEYKEFPFKRD